MFKRSEPPRTRVERRVARVSTADLPSWTEQSLNSLGREMTQWRRTGADTHLREAEEAAEAVLALIRELRTRTGT
jgi:hypothetical protein